MAMKLKENIGRNQSKK